MTKTIMLYYGDVEDEKSRGAAITFIVSASEL